MAYTYLIGWSKLNKWYYGVRYARECHPSELWITYKTSSKAVLLFAQTHGDPDVIEIRKEFSNEDDARKWEHKVLRRLKVVKNDRFLNKTDNISFSIESCQKGRQKRSGILHYRYGKLNERLSEINRNKVGDKNPFFGKRHTKEIEDRLSNINKNKYWITNEIDDIKINKYDAIPNGWRRGRKSSSIKNNIWINNGNIEKYISKEEDIPTDFSLGRLNRRR